MTATSKSKILPSALTAALRVETETPPMVVDPPEPPDGGNCLSPRPIVDLADIEAEGLGGDHRDHGAGRGAQVLTAEIDCHAAVGLNGHAALAVVAQSAPGIDADAEAALDRTARCVAARMAVFRPLDHLGGFVELRFVDVGLSR